MGKAKSNRGWLFKQWRVAASGLALTTFMVGGLILVLIPFQYIRWRNPSPEARNCAFLRLMSRAFRLFIRYMAWLRIMEPLRVEGREHLPAGTPFMVVANHPTLLDVVALLSQLEETNCIVKKALWNHFYLGGVVRAAGFIPNDHARQLMEDCQSNFETGRSLVIFPEGTRSPKHDLQPFNRGAAQIALRTGAQILPVVVTCEPPTLMKHQPWHEVPDEPFQLRLRFCPPLEIPDSIRTLNDPPLKARQLNRHLEDFFRRELGYSRNASAEEPACVR